MRARQVLIELDRAEEASALRDNNVSEIRDKANKALAASCAPQDTLEHQVKAVTKLCNGGILLKLNSNAAVAWFLDGETQKSFLSHFHPSATIKPRLYNVVVQFVPLSFRPGREADLREIKEVNGVEVRGISKVRWIKLVARRAPSQVCGHIILSLSYPHNPQMAHWLTVCLCARRRCMLRNAKESCCNALSVMGGTTWPPPAPSNSTPAVRVLSDTAQQTAPGWTTPTASRVTAMAM